MLTPKVLKYYVLIFREVIAKVSEDQGVIISVSLCSSWVK